MLFRILSALLASLALCSCSKPAQTADSFVEIKQAGVSLRFPSASFAGYSVKQEPKLTAQEIGTDIPIGVAPAHITIMFSDRRPLPALDKGPRYFLPARSYVALIPLEDKSVADFSKNYPQLSAAAAQLIDMLKDRPEAFGIKAPVPDLSSVDETQAIRCKVRYIDLPLISGLAYVTQYTQEDQGNPVNNEELTYVFQGMTKMDPLKPVPEKTRSPNPGRYYVDARFAITHASLPKGIDDANRIARDQENQYLRKAEKDLDATPDESFEPSLTVLRDILATISIAPN